MSAMQINAICKYAHWFLVALEYKQVHCFPIEKKFITRCTGCFANSMMINIVF